MTPEKLQVLLDARSEDEHMVSGGRLGEAASALSASIPACGLAAPDIS